MDGWRQGLCRLPDGVSQLTGCGRGRSRTPPQILSAYCAEEATPPAKLVLMGLARPAQALRDSRADVGRVPCPFDDQACTEWVPAGRVSAISRIPSVKTAAGDVSVPVSLAAPGPFTVTGGTAPRQPSEVVLDTALAAQAGIRPGGTIEVLSGSVPSRQAREFALLRLIGLTPGEVRGMMRREGKVIAADAIIIGSLAAAAPLIGLSREAAARRAAA